MYWYWSLVALVLAVFLIGFVGLLARYYFGKRLIEWVDSALLRVPLLNRITGLRNRSTMLFPRPTRPRFGPSFWLSFHERGCIRSGSSRANKRTKCGPKRRRMWFVCSCPPHRTQHRDSCVLVAENKVTKLEMSVADGIKYIISLGSLAPEYPAAPARDLRGTRAGISPRPAMVETTTGLVLRTRPLTETSLIVHWLTREFGRLATVAKGARRPNHPFLVNWTFFTGPTSALRGAGARSFTPCAKSACGKLTPSSAAKSACFSKRFIAPP